MFGRLGVWEIGLIVLIILIIFGAGKLPQVGREIGKGIGALRRGISSESESSETKDKD